MANSHLGSTMIGFPAPGEGSSGDIQLRLDGVPKMFSKLGATWYQNTLFTFGNGIEKVSRGLSVQADGKSVARFGDTIRLGKKDNDTSRLELDESGNFSIINRQGTTDTILLSVDTSGDISLNGNIKVGKADGTFSDTDNINIGQVQSGLGTYNVNIGYKAGEDADVGTTTSVLIGYHAGKNVTGASNTCIGSQAGDTITGGTYNTCLGDASDAGASNNNQVALGRNASTSADSAITIGTQLANSATRTCKIGDAGNSMISLDWDTSGDSTWTRSSDRRRKRNIQDNTLGLEFVNKLQTRTFQLKPQNELPEEWASYSETNRYDTDKVHIGFIAQELKALIDEYGVSDEVASWSEDPDGMQRAGETKLITPLIKAVQELSAKMDTMQEEINNLKEG